MSKVEAECVHRQLGAHPESCRALPEAVVPGMALRPRPEAGGRSAGERRVLKAEEEETGGLKQDVIRHGSGGGRAPREPACERQSKRGAARDCLQQRAEMQSIPE